MKSKKKQHNIAHTLCSSIPCAIILVSTLFISIKKRVQADVLSFRLYQINMQTTIKLTTFEHIFLEKCFFSHSSYIDKAVYAAEEKNPFQSQLPVLAHAIHPIPLYNVFFFFCFWRHCDVQVKWFSWIKYLFKFKLFHHNIYLVVEQFLFGL